MHYICPDLPDKGVDKMYPRIDQHLQRHTVNYKVVTNYISSRFSRNFGASASELVENIDEMFPQSSTFMIIPVWPLMDAKWTQNVIFICVKYIQNNTF